jgi:hypothetical protein
MKLSALRFLLPVSALAFLAPTAALAQKNSGNSSGPTVIPGGSVSATYVITQPGSYVLGGNRIMTDPTKPIVQVDAQDVTLDLGGFSLSFAGDAVASSWGIFIGSPENVAIRNGSIANAELGIWAYDGTGLYVGHVRISTCKYGIHSNASGTLIESCQIADTTVAGISSFTYGTIIRNCTIMNVVNGGGYGIMAGEAQIDGCFVSGGTVGISLGGSSVVSNCKVNNNVAGKAVQAVGHTLLRENHVVGNRGTAVAVDAPGVVLMNNVISGTVSHNGFQRGISATHPFLGTGNRLTGNGTNVVGGPMVDGGHNSLW